jgi:uncharacterized membrane protein YhaH (DUF805 family)
MKTYLFNLFDRRINRSTYAAGLLLNILFCLILSLTLYINGESFVKYVPDSLKIISVFIFIFMEFLIFLSLATRRWHDVGGEGWHWARGGIHLLLPDGQKEENKYGKPPPPKIDFKGIFGF